MARTVKRAVKSGTGRKAAPPAAAEDLNPPRRSTRNKPAIEAPIKDDKKRITKNKAEPKPKPVKYDCTTCGRTLVSGSFPDQNATGSCQHNINTCKACLKQWIEMNLESVTYDTLSCPECPEIMKTTDVEQFAVKKVYQKFVEMERRGIAEKVPGWRWCMNPKCKEGQVHEPLLKPKEPIDLTESDDEDEDEVVDGSAQAWHHANMPTAPGAYPELEKQMLPTRTRSEEKKRNNGKDSVSASDPTPARKKKAIKINPDDICTCNSCGAKACIPCDRPYHEGESCAQYQKRRKAQTEQEEKATQKLIDKECKQCPNKQCGRNIEKNGGCDSMVCSSCRTQFCWRCLVDYTTINRKGHDKDCIYARPGALDPHANNSNFNQQQLDALVAQNPAAGIWQVNLAPPARVNHGANNNNGGNNGGANNGAGARVNGMAANPFVWFGAGGQGNAANAANAANPELVLID